MKKFLIFVFFILALNAQAIGKETTFKKELFSPFISQSLLFLSFVVATFLPAMILKLKKN